MLSSPGNMLFPPAPLSMLTLCQARSRSLMDGEGFQRGLVRALSELPNT